MKKIALLLLLIIGLAFSSETTGFQVTFVVDSLVICVPVSGNENEFVEITDFPRELSLNATIRVEMSHEDQGLQSIQNTIYELTLVRNDGVVSQHVTFQSPVQIRLPFYGDSIDQVVLKYLDETESPAVWKKDGLSVVSINTDEDYLIASVMHFTKFSIFQYQDYQAPLIEWVKLNQQMCSNGGFLTEQPHFSVAINDQSQNDSGIVAYRVSLKNDDQSFEENVSGNLANISNTEVGLTINSVLQAGNYNLQVAVEDDAGNVTSINWQLVKTQAVHVSSLLVGPNPVNINKSNIHFTYDLSQNVDVSIKVFNVAGKKVKELNLSSGVVGASTGANHISWDGVDDQGNKLSTGIYFVYLVADNGQEKDVSKFILMVVK
ncbi:MAG: hypothetical protein A2Y40_03725 [Candidatus Margulisbacteria bacterium GWF2_35_9]|nr:MAG: hypothetical protein A2Y40_03725 [Candidatus Margulisbacteria bacterium GWF2_35_9]